MDREIVLDALNRHIRVRKDREIMEKYLTDYPGSLEKLAEETDVSVSTVKRVINRCSFIYKYLPD
jgi:predicted DNA-binding protein YlxM (UPF0122 family)